MLVLVTYDVNTSNKEGQSRLRKVAKYCESYGQRVQNSVFECILDYGQYVSFKSRLVQLIDEETDSIRLYSLGNKYANRVETMGIEKVQFKQDDILIV